MREFGLESLKYQMSEFLDLQVAERDGRVAVVLKEDAPFRNLAPVLRLASGVNAPGRILRRLHRRLERRRAAVVLENLDAIEPVLDMRALRDDHAAVPLAGTLENRVGMGGNDVVEGCGLAVTVLALVGIGMTVLKNLVLLASALVERLVVEVLDARVRVLRETEVELEREVAVLLSRHDVAAAAKLLVLRRKREPLPVGNPVYGAHRESAVLDDPALLRRRLAAALHGEPAVERLAVPRKSPALSLLGGGERVRALGRGLHLGLHLDSVADAALVADALDDGEEVVFKVQLVLKRADAVVADVGKRLERRHQVDLTARERNGAAVRLPGREVLDVDVVDPVAMLANRRGRILAAAVLPAEVDAEADPVVEVLDEIPPVRDVGKHLRRSRPVVVDRVLYVKLLDELVDLEKELARTAALLPRVLFVGRIIRHADDRLDAESLRELELLAQLRGVLDVDRADRIGRHAIGSALLLERRHVGVRRRERKVEVLYAEIVDIGLLHDLERLVKRPLVERVAGDAELERNCRKGPDRGNRSGNKQDLFHILLFNF